MKKHFIYTEGDLGHIPYGFVVLDTGIFVHGALGDGHCIRILYSQGDSDLRFGFPRGVEKEAKRVLEREYESRGLKWLLKQLDKEFININVQRRFYPPHCGWISRLEMSDVDKDIIKLCLMDNTECVVSKDLKDIVHNPTLRSALHNNYQLPKEKVFTPEEFCEEYNSKLVPYRLWDKLGTKWRTFKDRPWGKNR